MYLGPLVFPSKFYTGVTGLEGRVFMFVVVSGSEGVGYLILLFPAKAEKPLFPGPGGSVVQDWALEFCR